MAEGLDVIVQLVLASIAAYALVKWRMYESCDHCKGRKRRGSERCRECGQPTNVDGP